MRVIKSVKELNPVLAIALGAGMFLIVNYDIGFEYSIAKIPLFFLSGFIIVYELFSFFLR